VEPAVDSLPIVRTAKPSDSARLSALAALTFPLACPPQATAENIAAFIDEVLSESRFDAYLADPARTILVVESDQFVGYAMLVDGAPTDPDVAAAAALRPTVEISKLYVHPDAHGRGVAHLLMTTVIDLARASHLKAAWLGVNQLNIRAQKFYQKCGFEIVGTKSFWVGQQRHDDYVMERAL
jgi:ribosomal protein S18 acetylase RimI-like enzyme